MPPRDPLNTAVPPTRCAPALDLNRSRQLAGITLDEIAAAPKISLRFLQAIEAEEFEKLPGGIFTTSYLRQYASAIGYDESTLLAHYQRKTNPQAAAAAEPRADGESRNRLDRWLRMPAQASRE